MGKETHFIQFPSSHVYVRKGTKALKRNSVKDKMVKLEFNMNKVNIALTGWSRSAVGQMWSSPSSIYSCRVTAEKRECSSIKKALGQFVVMVVLLHVLRVVLQAAYELCDRMGLEADLVHGVEQWEPGRMEETLMRAQAKPESRPEAPCGALLLDLLVDQVFVLEDVIDLCCCRWSLQLLPVQHLLLQLLDGLTTNRVLR